MQSPDDIIRISKNKEVSQRDLDIQEYQKIQNDTYNELMNESLSIQLLLFWAFVVLIVIIPIQAMSDEIMKILNLQEFFQTSTSYEVFQLLYYIIPLLSVIAIGYSNIKFVNTFNDRLQFFEEIQAKLKEVGKESSHTINVSETQHYKLILRIETAFVVGTFLVACLWFLEPSHSRLEPLTIIYGFGTAIFEYFRTKLAIPNPLDRFIVNK
jgi:hypothetical protein